MMPGKTLRKAAAPASPAGREAAAAECAQELLRIGDRWDLRQRILNLLSKLFCPEIMVETARIQQELRKKT